ncbi:MAG: MBL fold metallo-hydrolase [Acidimicrobiia bacterium]|nr:MBL fold metallo-hydrolase [Acidimicrobiia bacterium]MDH3462206.1 MBL fold metallo-hydrolase [Acidimicrobiia bacterium]
MRIDRVLANNPGPFTGPGTNTWVIEDGTGRVVVIDPGPVDAVHEDAIMKQVADRTVVGVLVTHTHIDHAPMANPMAKNLGVAASGHGPGPHFRPDIVLVDGASVPLGDTQIEVIHTPGHADDHLCFRVGDVLFSGDHIIGGSSVMVETMGPYLDSLKKLKGTGLRTILPGHGETIDDPDAVIDWYLAHRLQRHHEILDAVHNGAGTVGEVVEMVYRDVDSSLYPLAARSVKAHLVLLSAEGQIALDKDNVVLEPPPTQ